MADSWLDLLREEFQTRQQRNPQFSMRSFARVLKVSPSTLSDLLAGKKKVSVRVAMKIVDQCGFSPERRQAFLASAVSFQLDSALVTKDDKEFHLLRDDELELVSHWQHYAILSLGELPDAKYDPAWVSGKLNIPIDAAKSALEDLLRLEFIEVDGESFRQSIQPIRSRQDFPSRLVRRYHAELMNKGLDCLEKVGVEQRDVTSMTMAVDSRRLQVAKKMIKDFRRGLSDYLSGGEKDCVYALQISLIPLSDAVGASREVEAPPITPRADGVASV